MTGLSSHCQQKIQHNCNNNPLTGASSWKDINNNKNSYWYGNHASSQTGCTCSLDNSCNSSLPGNFKCNCDTYAMNSVDVGVLTSTSKLPVIELYYGGSVNSLSKIIYKLEALVCSGKSSYYPSEAAKVQYETLLQKSNQLEQKLGESQELLKNALNDTQNFKLAIDDKIENLINQTEISIATIQTEQYTLHNKTLDSLNETIESLESHIETIKPKLAAFRWTGMQSRTGNPSELMFFILKKTLINLSRLAKQTVRYNQ